MPVFTAALFTIAKKAETTQIVLLHAKGPDKLGHPTHEGLS